MCLKGPGGENGEGQGYQGTARLPKMQVCGGGARNS